MCGLVLLLSIAPASAQAPSSSAFDDLIPELVAKIASAIPAGIQLSLTVTVGDSSDDAPAIRTRVASLSSARGLQIVGATAAGIEVAVGCGRNLRERVCVAHITGDGRDQIAAVTRPLTSVIPDPQSASLALELRPLLSQQRQMLDVAVVDDRLLVLDVAAVSVFERKDGAWRAVQSRPLPVLRPWPRDPRGRIRVEGNKFDLFLPAMTCTGRTDSLEMTCTEGQQAWPIGMDNRGLEPGRNYFRTPEGAVFYNAAPLGAGATDDAIGLTAACAPGAYVVAVAAGRNLDVGDLLQLSRVANGRLVQAASPVVLPGVLTALWTQPDHISALVVTHEIRGGRYDAFQTTISCSR